MNVENAVRMKQAVLRLGFSDAGCKLLDESLLGNPSSYDVWIEDDGIVSVTQAFPFAAPVGCGAVPVSGVGRRV